MHKLVFAWLLDEQLNKLALLVYGGYILNSFFKGKAAIMKETFNPATGAICYEYILKALFSAKAVNIHPHFLNPKYFTGELSSHVHENYIWFFPCYDTHKENIKHGNTVADVEALRLILLQLHDTHIPYTDKVYSIMERTPMILRNEDYACFQICNEFVQTNSKIIHVI